MQTGRCLSSTQAGGASSRGNAWVRSGGAHAEIIMINNNNNNNSNCNNNINKCIDGPLSEERRPFEAASRRTRRKQMKSSNKQECARLCSHTCSQMGPVPYRTEEQAAELSWRG